MSLLAEQQDADIEMKGSDTVPALKKEHILEGKTGL